MFNKCNSLLSFAYAILLWLIAPMQNSFIFNVKGKFLQKVSSRVEPRSFTYSMAKLKLHNIYCIWLFFMLDAEIKTSIQHLAIQFTQKMRTDLYFIQCWTDAFKIGIWCHRRVIHWMNIWLHSSKIQPWNKWFPWLKLARMQW